MFGQERCRYHSHPVMHKTGFIQLTHPCIYNRVTGIALAPAGKLVFVIAPFNKIVFCSKRKPLAYMRKMPEDHLKEIAPDKLIQISFIELHGFLRQLPNADSAKTQMHSQ